MSKDSSLLRILLVMCSLVVEYEGKAGEKKEKLLNVKGQEGSYNFDRHKNPSRLKHLLCPSLRWFFRVVTYPYFPFFSSFAVPCLRPLCVLALDLI